MREIWRGRTAVPNSAGFRATSLRRGPVVVGTFTKVSLVIRPNEMSPPSLNEVEVPAARSSHQPAVSAGSPVRRGRPPAGLCAPG